MKYVRTQTFCKLSEWNFGELSYRKFLARKDDAAKNDDGELMVWMSVAWSADGPNWPTRFQGDNKARRHCIPLEAIVGDIWLRVVARSNNCDFTHKPFRRITNLPEESWSTCASFRPFARTIRSSQPARELWISSLLRVVQIMTVTVRRAKWFWHGLPTGSMNSTHLMSVTTMPRER